MFRSQPLWQKMQAFQHKVQQLSTMEICNVLLATGLGLLIIGKFERLIMTSIIGMTTSMCGSSSSLLELQYSLQLHDRCWITKKTSSL